MPSNIRRQQVPSPELHHLKALDGIRGFAILMVLATHCFESNTVGRGFALHLVGQALECGRFGVDLFFVLSGFLITGILIDTRHDPRFFKNFFGRRALRIFPLYYGVLGTLLICTMILHWRWDGMAPLLLTYLQNLRPFAIDTLAVGPGISLFHFWSLAIEEQFYLLWPLVVYALRGSLRGVAFFTLLGSGVVLLLRLWLTFEHTPYLWIHMSLPTRADSLLLGGLLAAAYRSGPAWRQVSRWSSPVCAMLGFCIFFPIFRWNIMAGPAVWFIALRYTALAVFFAALIGASLQIRSPVNRLFEMRWLRALGKYSYGIYVLHVLVLSLVRLPLRAALLHTTGSKGLAVVGSGVVSILLSCVAAWLSYQLVEKRFLRLKRYFSYAVVEPARTGPGLAFTGGQSA